MSIERVLPGYGPQDYRLLRYEMSLSEALLYMALRTMKHDLDKEKH